MRLLLHTCCALCLASIVNEIKNFEITGYWYNPNIHPYNEYKARLDSVKKYVSLENLNVIYDTSYPVKDFILGQLNANERCEYCYSMRIESTILTAKKYNIEYFTTTLLVSKSQKHYLLKNICEKLAEKYSINFYYKDYRYTNEICKKYGKSLALYRQNYCGCIFSEVEKFKV